MMVCLLISPYSTIERQHIHCRNVWITSICFGYLSCIEQIDDLQLRCPNWVRVTQLLLQCLELEGNTNGEETTAFSASMLRS